MTKQSSNERYISAMWVVIPIIILLVIANYPLHASLRSWIPDSSLREQAIAALIGSIFGALLGSVATTFGILVTDRLRETRNRDHERRVKHYNSVVRLQREMNVIRGSLEDNTSALKSIIEANALGLPTLQRPIEIATNESHFFDLYDIELINMLNDLYYLVRRLNLDSVNLTRTLDVLADQLFASKITNVQYKNEVQVFNDSVVKMRSHILYTLDHSVLDIIAYVRICADRDASEEMKNRQAKILEGREPITETDINTMRDTIKHELEQSEAEGLAQQQEEANYN